jgi:hypothetical protein
MCNTLNRKETGALSSAEEMAEKGGLPLPKTHCRIDTFVHQQELSLGKKDNEFVSPTSALAHHAANNSRNHYQSGAGFHILCSNWTLWLLPLLETSCRLARKPRNTTAHAIPLRDYRLSSLSSGIFPEITSILVSTKSADGSLNVYFSLLPAFQLNNQYGFVDVAGSVVIPSLYDDARGFSEGLAAVKVKDAWGYVNPIGEFAISPKFVGGEFRAALRFVDGVGRAPSGDKFGYINRNGEFIIAPRFDTASAHSEGLACVRLDDLYGFIDTHGNIKIAARFPFASDFNHGLARVRVGQEDCHHRADRVEERSVLRRPTSETTNSLSVSDRVRSISGYFSGGGRRFSRHSGSRASLS